MARVRQIRRRDEMRDRIPARPPNAASRPCALRSAPAYRGPALVGAARVGDRRQRRLCRNPAAERRGADQPVVSGDRRKCDRCRTS